MEKYLPLLQKSPLFAAMAPGEILSVLHCVGAAVRESGAGEYILPAGSPTQAMGLLLSGSALAVQEDLWGERNIMGKIQPPGTFAEPFAATPGAVLNVSIVANAPAKVMFLSIQRILHRLLGDLPAARAAHPEPCIRPGKEKFAAERQNHPHEQAPHTGKTPVLSLVRVAPSELVGI
ncbi:MAG: cyclic nucleotide-binding domain-containing protein [Oscillospiraceae bacterium]